MIIIQQTNMYICFQVNHQIIHVVIFKLVIDSINILK